MKLALSKNVVAALIVFAIGLAAFIDAQRNAFGSLRAIGPGFMPTIVSACLMVIGVLMLARAVVAEAEALPRIAWRPLLLVTAGLLAFFFSMSWVGYLPAIFLTCVIVALADKVERPLTMLAVIVGLCVFSWFVFTLLLGIPMPAFRIS